MKLVLFQRKCPCLFLILFISLSLFPPLSFFLLLFLLALALHLPGAAGGPTFGLLQSEDQDCTPTSFPGEVVNTGGGACLPVDSREWLFGTRNIFTYYDMLTGDFPSSTDVFSNLNVHISSLHLH